MREVDSNLFCRWEDELPSPQDLMPLSQSLITPDLALAFNIPNPNHHHHTPQPHPPPSQSSADIDSPDAAGGGAGGLDEQARTLKRPRLVWTPQLHKRFVDAVAHVGIKNAVPKTIMQLMSVDGLTRENVASHLQKYRLYLKRMQGMSSNGGGNSPADAAMDRLFASSPVPPQFLHPSRSTSDHFMPFPPAQQQHPMVAVGPHFQPQIQQQFRHFGNSPQNGQFEHHHLMRQPQMQILRSSSGSGSMAQPVYVDDLESPSAVATNGKKILSLFPSG